MTELKIQEYAQALRLNTEEGNFDKVEELCNELIAMDDTENDDIHKILRIIKVEDKNVFLNMCYGRDVDCDNYPEPSNETKNFAGKEVCRKVIVSATDEELSARYAKFDAEGLTK